MKTLKNFKNAPCLHPLASVRDLSPPTSGGKRSRNGGIGRGRILFRYDSNYYIYLRRKTQNKNTEAKMSANCQSMEFGLDLNRHAATMCNEFYPLYFRPDLTSALKLRWFFRCNNGVIDFNHRYKKLTKGGAL